MKAKPVFTQRTNLIRKNHIPCSRAELLTRICASPRLSAGQQQQFRAFGDLLSALVHFQAHGQYERMKNDLLLVDGHEKTQAGRDNSNIDAGQRARINQLVADFSETLDRANYHPISMAEIEETLNRTSIIPVRTAVDFSDFELMAFYYRNKTPQKLTVKKLFRSREIVIQNYDRIVVLLITAAGLASQRSSNATSQVDRLEANKVYLNLYKNIPHADLELLFPNIKISMTLKDKLMLGIPALGAAIPMALKILPSIGLLIGLIALTVFGFELGGTFKVDPESAKATYALLTAILSIGLALGGFAAQQYLKYKSKRLSFLKKVADTLFFKTLDVGKGVISSIVDAAEEEQCKEMLLTYFLLYCSQDPMTELQLDRAAEAWLANEFKNAVDFKIGKALEEISAIVEPNSNESLLNGAESGNFTVCELDTAMRIIDRIWDNAFRYANPPENTE